MAAQALYRRWRSQTFDEVVGQEHVTRTLQNALRDGRLAHAYLFAGPRGTGKTSTARILAKAVNCLAEPDERPCNRCAICQAITEGRLLDLIEIDAASNTSVEDVRELRDKVSFHPNEARMKFYIIDEVHMLSNSAFNALLKTLEEPPPHVVFVLCTTEPHRIPATVLSRCQRFDFRRLSVADIAAHLARIARAEGFEAEPEALDLIARTATGSMRDAVSLLDQLLAYGEKRITVALVRSVLGTVSEQVIGEWIAMLARRDISAGLALLNRLVMDGIELRELARQALAYLRGALLIKASGFEAAGGGLPVLDVDAVTLEQMRAIAREFSLSRLIQAIRLFGQATADLRIGAQSPLPLELAFVEAALSAPEPAEEAASKPEAELTPAPILGPAPLPPRQETATALPGESAAVQGPSQGPISGEEKLALLRSSWHLVRQELQARSPAALSVLSARRGVRFLSIEGQQVIIGYQEQARYAVENVLQKPEVVEALERALSHLFGSPHSVKYVPEESYRPGAETQPSRRATTAQPSAPPSMDALAEIAASEWDARVDKL
ncbi:MAG: DNA polymerase III subunit gamma/tau [Anaerolineae bacterium]|nr:DNA polymerase III subunit gamma/tau [Anaerolineae bacterium]MDW8100295.1 DNA polymerase III subunit gamma/tau [Anaerolineae bacterium]